MMRRTSPGILIAVAAAGLGAGFLMDQLLTAWGRATITLTATLPILLVMLAALDVLLAIPVARWARGTGPPVDPFRALRVAVLAKASSVVGAAVAGFATGLVLFLLTRPVAPSIGSITAQIATVIGGVILVIAALIAEYLCTIRKDDDDESPGQPPTGLSAPEA